MTIIYNGRVIRGGVVEPCGSVAFENGVLVDAPLVPCPEDEIIDAGGQYVSAGFVDIHTHGGNGYDFLDATPEAFLNAAELHAKHGSTTIAPTATSGAYETTLQMLQAYETARQNNPRGADMPGIHFEGPYFSPVQSGAQDPDHLRVPNPAEYNTLLNAGSRILRWSSAPELPGSKEFAEALKAHGVLASIGHSDADYDEVVQAMEWGFTHVTHLYSACSTVRRKNAYRIAGIVESAYLLDDMTVEIIADGKHLPAPLLQMVYRFIGPDRTALVTDSVRGAGMPNGMEITLGSKNTGVRAIIEDDVAKLLDRTAFAGSVATMDRLLRNMVNMANATVTDAVKMATETPARIIGLTDRGTLDVGKRADIVLFDDDFHVSRTIVGGRTVYCKQ